MLEVEWALVLYINKCVAAFRYLGCSIAYDTSDKYLKVYEMAANKCVDHFCTSVYEFFHK